MRIGIVSTYPPIECGIATYTYYLRDALEQKGNEVYIFSQYGAKGDYVFGTYSAQEKSIAANIFEMVSKMTPDMLHIQHEFGLYGHSSGKQVLELVFKCQRLSGLPVVVTFHTVQEKFLPEQEYIVSSLIQESRAIIVHEAYHQKILTEHFGQADKIYVIPHGVREVEEVPEARRKIGVEGKKVILLCGYLRETKRFDRIVKIFPEVAKAVDDVVLVVASKSRSVDHPEYQRKFYRMIEESPATDRIIVLHGQFPQPIFDTIVSAADVVPFPYEIGGQSGIMAHCFAFSKPVVTSGLSSFRSWVEASGGGLVANSDEEFAEHLIKILTDDKLRARLRQNIAKFVSEKVSWKVVADQHLNIYRKYAWQPTPRSRHFG